MADWLNYHHLLYFWTVAKEGGITRASEKLHLAQPTLSSQIRKLEQNIGAKLFDRVGDYVLVMKDNYVVEDSILGEKRPPHIGHHGGVSSGEMFVPLIVINL